MLLRLLALAFPLFLGWPSQGPPEPAAELPPCATCAGVGSALLECGACHGARNGPCAPCTDPVGQHRRELDAHIRAFRDPETAKRIAAARGDLARSLDQLGVHATGLTTLTPGVLPCPAKCIGGKTMNRGMPCLPCKGSRGIECVDCKGKGLGRCWSCAGQRRVHASCPECAGAGRSVGIEGRAAAELAACPWCADAQVRDCRGCPEGGEELRSCDPCAGVGHLPCGACAGTRQMPCKKCFASGDLGSFIPPTGIPAPGRCDACSARGSVPCDGCRRGRIDCETCAGKGRASQSCRACLGRKLQLCLGCKDGGSRAWQVTAERLLAAGERELACAHLEEALRREAARIEAELEHLAAPQAEQTRLRRDLERERLAPLRRRLEQMRKE